MPVLSSCLLCLLGIAWGFGGPLCNARATAVFWNSSLTLDLVAFRLRGTIASPGEGPLSLTLRPLWPQCDGKAFKYGLSVPISPLAFPGDLEAMSDQ